MNSLKVSFWKEEKKGWLFMAMVWNVKFDWLGNLFIGFSQRLKYRNTGRHDGHWWHLCEGVHPVDCIHV